MRLSDDVAGTALGPTGGTARLLPVPWRTAGRRTNATSTKHCADSPALPVAPPSRCAVEGCRARSTAFGRGLHEATPGTRATRGPLEFVRHGTTTRPPSNPSPRFFVVMVARDSCSPSRTPRGLALAHEAEAWPDTDGVDVAQPPGRRASSEPHPACAGAAATGMAKPSTVGAQPDATSVWTMTAASTGAAAGIVAHRRSPPARAAARQWSCEMPRGEHASSYCKVKLCSSRLRSAGPCDRIHRARASLRATPCPLAPWPARPRPWRSNRIGLRLGGRRACDG